MAGTVLAWVGRGERGELLPADTAAVSVFDRGFRAGEGVFESLRAYGEHPFRLRHHLERAAAGATALGFALPDLDAVGDAVVRTIAANDTSRDSGVRLTATPGDLDPTSPFPGSPVGPPTVVVTVQPLAIDPSIYRDGVAAAALPGTRDLPDVKAVAYLSAIMARREAHRRGAHEALLLGSGGTVLEGSASNVFAVVDGRLVTPPLDAGILPGVTRAVTVQLARALDLPLEERALTTDELLAADEAFLTASTRELVPLVRVDDRTIGDGVPGRVTIRLLTAYREEVERERSGSSG